MRDPVEILFPKPRATDARQGADARLLRATLALGLPALLLAACAQPPARPPAAPILSYTREAPVVLPVSDTNVYSFKHQGPDSAGTAAVTARPTAGPNAAPAGSIGGAEGRAKAEAAATFYGANAICGGGQFAVATDLPSSYDAARNSWTVFGRCASA